MSDLGPGGLEPDDGGPEWTCAACGSSGPFESIRYDTPGEPVEYDMGCECGSRDIRESAREAAHALGDRLDEARAEREVLREALEGLVLVCAPGMPMLQDSALDTARAVLSRTKAGRT